MAASKVAVVTGTNSNLGINICYRLIEREEPGTKLTLIVTSRTLPRVREVIEQIKIFISKMEPKAIIVDYDYLLVDFSNMISVLNAYYELSKKYEAINYFFVNAAQGVYDGIDWISAVKDVLRDPLDAVTNPQYKIQKVGVKSRDGLGLVFQSNVFGPYYLIQKLVPQLSKGKARVIWISSIMSAPKYLSFDDLELLKTNASYEGSKREVDLLHMATYKQLREQGIHQYVVQPGIFISHSFYKYLNLFTYYGMLLLFYLARWLGSVWHNIDGYKAANSPVYVATFANVNFEKQNVKYGSATYRDGMEFIKIEEIDDTGATDVLKYMQQKKQQWDENLKDQITNTRVPI